MPEECDANPKTVEALNDLASTLPSLEDAIASLAVSNLPLRIIHPPVVLDGPNLVDFHRHLTVVLEARKLRYSLNGLNRTKSSETPGRNLAQFAALHNEQGERNEDSVQITVAAEGSRGERSWSWAVSETAKLLAGQTIIVESLVDVFVSVRQFADTVRRLHDADVELALLREDVDTRRPRDRQFMRNVGLISGFDRQLHQNVGRQNQALAAADGRPSGPRPKLNQAEREQARALYAAGAMTVLEIANRFGVGRGTVYRALQASGGDHEATPHAKKRRSPAVPRGAFQGPRGVEG